MLATLDQLVNRLRVPYSISHPWDLDYWGVVDHNYGIEYPYRSAWDARAAYCSLRDDWLLQNVE